MRLAGKKALVTGAARGIGLGCAKLMAHHGCDVVIADIDISEANRVAKGVTNHGAIELDVTDKQAWGSAVEQAGKLMNGINVLVNNAGIIIPGTVEGLDEAGWDRTMDVDLKSVYLGCQAALPVLSLNAPASRAQMSPPTMQPRQASICSPNQLPCTPLAHTRAYVAIQSTRRLSTPTWWIRSQKVTIGRSTEASWPDKSRSAE
jgi:NAD(P)-dependent dehydrogenase (short-subunit alcohol dehydrogenase family)